MLRSIIILTTSTTLTLLAVILGAHLLGVDGTCDSKWAKTQDRLSISPAIGLTGAQQPQVPQWEE